MSEAAIRTGRGEASARGSTEGNRQLYELSKKLTGWLREEFGLCGRALPYQVSSGGAYVKDAAALAGMGIIGRNNLLITREFGPRVRLRAMQLDVECESAVPLDFSPCDDCSMPCQSACPQDAFAGGSFSRRMNRLQWGTVDGLSNVFSSAQSTRLSELLTLLEPHKPPPRKENRQGNPPEQPRGYGQG